LRVGQRRNASKEEAPDRGLNNIRYCFHVFLSFHDSSYEICRSKFPKIFPLSPPVAAALGDSAPFPRCRTQ
jgi:hypothetical protein